VVSLFNPTNRTLSGKIRYNSGRVPPDALSPVEHQAVNFALPTDSGKTWSKARLVDLEEFETEVLTLDADGTVSLDIMKNKIVTMEFLP
jgi:hypothetical protein